MCCTYKRPRELETVTEISLRQDYPAYLREMIILDDTGQYRVQGLDGWRLISSPVRFRTLGEKRNASAVLASADVDAYCVWDDDDVYLLWHMSAAAAALVDADYIIPSVIYHDKNTSLRRVPNARQCHGSWTSLCRVGISRG